MNQLISSVFLSVALAGCAADVASTAATDEAPLSADEARRTEQLKDQVRSRLNAAMRAEQDRLQQTEKASTP